MSDFGRMENPTARKNYRCEWCYGPIPKGEKHRHYTGVWEDEWQDWRMHEECHADAEHAYEGFTPGEGAMPERVRLLLAEAE